jgi:hypothetical protein
VRDKVLNYIKQQAMKKKRRKKMAIIRMGRVRKRR